jgi:SAM-dependent methyltransferase
MPERKCLACGGTRLRRVLDLGEQPLANDYRATGDQPKHPLDLWYCDDCFHAQLGHFVDPHAMYSNYLYVSGTSQTLTDYFASFADRVTAKYGVGSILDIACNDGTMLKAFKDRGWAVFGVDPAKNLWETTTAKGIPVYVGYWDELLATRFGKFDVVTAFNVLAHGPNPLSFLRGMRHVATKAMYVLTSQANMFAEGQFDTVYHEHHSFFSVNSFIALANRAGVNWPVTVTQEPIHGTSYLFEMSDPMPQYERKTARVLYRLDRMPTPLVAYGAAAKAVVMLNASKCRPDYVVDENPLKQGTVIPGTDIPIVAPSVLGDDERDLHILVTAWNFWDEICAKVRKLRPCKNDIFLNPYGD